MLGRKVLTFNKWYIFFVTILLIVVLNTLVNRVSEAFGHALLSLELNEDVLLFSRLE